MCALVCISSWYLLRLLNYLKRSRSSKEGKITFNFLKHSPVLIVNGIELRITGLSFCFEIKFNEVFNPIFNKIVDISLRENDSLTSPRKSPDRNNLTIILRVNDK